MKALLIDPFTQTIEDVENDGSNEAIYAAIDCETLDAVALNANTVLYVDDVGLYKEGQKFFQLVPGAPVLAGKGIIYGLDKMGDNVSHDIITEKVRGVITWPDIEFDGMSTEDHMTTHPLFGTEPVFSITNTARFRDRVSGRPWYPTVANEGFADDGEPGEDAI